MMEISWVFIALGAWIIALAFLSKKFNHPKRKLPPGPRPWPIIGNLNLLGSLPHESLHHLSQKYGDLMLLKFGSKPVLIASSPEMAKEILKTHDAIFASRPALAADHKAKREAEKNYTPTDMVDVLLNLADDNLEIKLTTDSLMGLIQNLLVGATDTSALTIEWVFQELLRKPNIMEKAYQELDRAIGKERWVEEEDFSQIPYIDAIIKETFRLHPLCTLLPPHYSIDDCNVAGYDIPKGTTVYVNAWSLGRNPKYWDRSEEFMPERFIENDIDMKGQNFTLLPFGSGRRRCPGYSLGIKVVQTTLANLLHGFNWKLAGDMKPEDISMEETYGLTTHPNKPISMIMEPRLPLHLY
ncbi:cytochrome P450 71A1 isoform X2 [Capsicum annuum]|uniref:cytochrome P450 71A1 isoform X2 n=1 Tax=Capsicum annuum TaxID=4072 RepID=UPI001FB0CFAE|nr:cytochrome P450 71A1 isoform X2 [Capsicum annuum]